MEAIIEFMKYAFALEMGTYAGNANVGALVIVSVFVISKTSWDWVKTFFDKIVTSIFQPTQRWKPPNNRSKLFEFSPVAFAVFCVAVLIVFDKV